jgi:membrane-bound serine protease (ClpP class)
MSTRIWLAGFLWLAVVPGAAAGSAPPGAPAVGWVRVEGAIQPASTAFVERSLRWAARDELATVVIELDTPGGLDGSMRRIVKAILASRVPVVVFVAPPGSRAASAGVFLMMAAHVAAMAPGTNIGAAHPVAIGGGLPGGGSEAVRDTTMLAKVTNDAVAYVRSLAEERGRNADWAEKAVRESVSVPAEDALRLGVCDLIARDRTELLAALEGRTVKVGGEPRVLALAGARVSERRPDVRDQILGVIADPTVAYLLLLLGVLGIFFELSHPGTLFPGIVGALALLLSFFALQTLPVRAAGVALILLSLVLFLLEIKITSYGALAMGAIASLLFGSLMLFDGGGGGPRLSLGVILPTLLVVGGLCLFGVVMAARAQRRRVSSGAEGLVGEVGEVRSDLAPRGRVFVHGELWNATSDAPVRRGQAVRVVRVEGLQLRVTPVSDAGYDPGR